MKHITTRYAESQEKTPRTLQEELDHLETRWQEDTPHESILDAFERLVNGAGGKLV